MLVESDLDHLRSGVADKNGTLIVVGKFKKLLAEVVSEWVWSGR